jgi:uncharacterized membrane protein
VCLTVVTCACSGSPQALATLQSAPTLDRAALGRVVGALRARAAALLWHLVVAQVRHAMKGQNSGLCEQKGGMYQVQLCMQILACCSSTLCAQ